ncbi:MAG: asparaginase domain-containing protein [Paracoccaceae bacterium]
MIHSGGTIGMGPGPAGYAPKEGLVEEALAVLSRRGLAGQTALTALRPLIDSAHATPDDWNRIAATIEAAHEQHQGFVVTHGTDTMAFTGAALAMALEGLGRPVVLTGAMLPLGQPGSDGPRNLADAVLAARTAPPGVWLQFGGQLLHGARLRKHSSALPEAFAAAPGAAPPLRPGAALTRHAYLPARLAILTVAPGGSGAAIGAALDHLDGAVLRVFGAGTLPNDPDLAMALHRAQTRGTLMLAVSQCAEGGLSPGAYAAGSLMEETGILPGADMTAEAAYAKLALALSLPGDQRGPLLARTLCGESAGA